MKRLLILLLLTASFVNAQAPTPSDFVGVQVKQSGTDKGVVVGGKAVLDFTGCTTIKTGNVFAITCTGAGAGITSINGDSTLAQTFATGTSGTDVGINDDLAGGHTINVPVASATNTGKLSNSNWTTFNAKMSNPFTTLGDTLYAGAAAAPTRLAGNTTSVKQFFCQTGTGSVSAAPAWCSVVAGDVPTLNQSTTGNAATATAFDHTPTQCGANTKADGIAASGAANCTTVPNAALVNSSVTIGSTSVSLGASLTPATGRGSSGLNVESATGHGDSAYTILNTDRLVFTNAAFTAARTWPLPAANTLNPGQPLVIVDAQGTLTSTNTLTISRAGSDTINGGTQIVLSAAYDSVVLWSDGTSKWFTNAAGEQVNAVTAAGYTVLSADSGKLITLSNASAQTVNLPATVPIAGWSVELENIGAATWTLSGNGNNIDAQANSHLLRPIEGVRIVSDGTSYYTQSGRGFSRAVNAQTGTTYTLASTDRGQLVTLSNAASVAVTLPQAGSSGTFRNGWHTYLKNIGAGTVTVTPATSTISGASTVTMETGESCLIISDGTNYECVGFRATAGSNVTLTKTRSGVQFAASGGGTTPSGGGWTAYSAIGLTLSGTQYFPPGGGGSPSGTEANVDAEAPSAAAVSSFYAVLSGDPGNGNTVAFTFRDAGSDSAVTCTITGNGSTATDCRDITHSFTPAAQDKLAVKVVTTGTVVGTLNVMFVYQVGTPIGTAHGVAALLACAAASASGTAYTCSTSPTFTPAANDAVLFVADVANTGSATLNVNSSSAKTMQKQGGSAALANLAANDLIAGHRTLLVYDGTVWQMQGQLGNSSGGGGTPAGSTGNIQYNNGGAFGGIANGQPGQVLGTPFVGSVALFMNPDNNPLFRTYAYIWCNGETLFSIGVSAVDSSGATCTAPSGSVGPYEKLTTATSQNSDVALGEDNNSTSGYTPARHNEVLTTHFGYDSTNEAANDRTFIGYTNGCCSNMVSSDTPNQVYVGFFSRTSDSNWQCVNATSNADQVIASTANANNATQYFGTIQWDTANSKYRFYMGTSPTALTEVCTGSTFNKPAANTAMGVFALMRKTDAAATARVLRVQFIYKSVDNY